MNTILKKILSNVSKYLRKIVIRNSSSNTSENHARKKETSSILQQNHHKKMTQTPVPSLVLALAIPTIISMLVTAIYNMADTYFASHLGTSAAGAVGVVASLMLVIQTVGFTLGTGSGNFIGRMLGAKQDKEATEIASTAFFSALLLGCILCLVGNIFLSPMVRVLGATQTIAPYAEDYARWILFAAPIMCASFVMNNILRGEGRTALSMVGITVGGMLNIILDPIFIFTLGLGVEGAAIATAISQCVGFFILLVPFLSGKSGVRLCISRVSRRLCVYKDIFRMGLPSFCGQGVGSVATMLQNLQAAVYGDAAIAAMGIVGRFFWLLFSVILGFGQGFQPVASFNYGAKRYDRVHKATVFTLQMGTALMLCAAVLSFWFAPYIIALFRSGDVSVTTIGVLAFRLECFVVPMFGLSTTTIMALQCTGHSKSATFLSLCRQGICFVPIILTLPHVIDLLGVQLAQPISDAISSLICIPFLVHFLHELRSKHEVQQVISQ